MFLRNYRPDISLHNLNQKVFFRSFCSKKFVLVPCLATLIVPIKRNVPKRWFILIFRLIFFGKNLIYFSQGGFKRRFHTWRNALDFFSSCSRPSFHPILVIFFQIVKLNFIHLGNNFHFSLQQAAFFVQKLYRNFPACSKYVELKIIIVSIELDVR